MPIEMKEIWACAHQLMRQYGEAAGLHAAQRADELLAADELEGHRLWLQILARIEDLGKLEPQGSVN